MHFDAWKEGMLHAKNLKSKDSQRQSWLLCCQAPADAPALDLVIVDCTVKIMAVDRFGS